MREAMGGTLEEVVDASLYQFEFLPLLVDRHAIAPLVEITRANWIGALRVDLPVAPSILANAGDRSRRRLAGFPVDALGPYQGAPRTAMESQEPRYGLAGFSKPWKRQSPE